LGESSTFVPSDFGNNASLCLEASRLWRYIAMDIAVKFDHLSKLPYLLANVTVPEVAQLCLAQYDALEPSQHHRMSVKFLDAEGHLRSSAARTTPEPTTAHHMIPCLPAPQPHPPRQCSNACCSSAPLPPPPVLQLVAALAAGRRGGGEGAGWASQDMLLLVLALSLRCRGHGCSRCAWLWHSVCRILHKVIFKT
jgi:hypothetical protein